MTTTSLLVAAALALGQTPDDGDAALLRGLKAFPPPKQTRWAVEALQGHQRRLAERARERAASHGADDLEALRLRGLATRAQERLQTWLVLYGAQASEGKGPRRHRVAVVECLRARLGEEDFKRGRMPPVAAPDDPPFLQ